EAEKFLTGTDSYNNKKSSPKKVTKASNIDDFDVVIYTDGGSRNHGNVKGGHVRTDDKAAWAYHISNNGQTYEGTAGELGATNNRMEIMALIQSIIRLNDLKIKQQ